MSSVGDTSGTRGVYWIDHYTIPTNDLRRSIAFHERILGTITMPETGMPLERGAFQAFSHPELLLRGGHCHQGLFVMRDALPTSQAPGAGFARHALFIRPEDINEHVRRLDESGVVRSDPVHTASEGEEGTAIYWLDSDGNQFEFWAPRQMPSGAMDDAGPLKVGRISHVVYASRDLQRTTAFFNRYCGLQALQSAEIPEDTVVFPLAAAGRLVFKRTEEPGPRVSGLGVFSDCHTALVVAEEEYWPKYERMWAELPEWEYDEKSRQFVGDGARMPARTLRHGSPAGQQFKKAFGRGDDWVDPDGNLFHFVGGRPLDKSMVFYERFFLEDYMDEYLAKHKPAAP
jgi:catechol 2,3-dioxygenase-like lactoylglutathione lyase family enzyme